MLNNTQFGKNALNLSSLSDGKGNGTILRFNKGLAQSELVFSLIDIGFDDYVMRFTR